MFYAFFETEFHNVTLTDLESLPDLQLCLTSDGIKCKHKHTQPYFTCFNTKMFK